METQNSILGEQIGQSKTLWFVSFLMHSSAHMQLKQQKIEDLLTWDVRRQILRQAQRLEIYPGESQRDGELQKKRLLNSEYKPPNSSALNCAGPGETTRRPL